jgi:hypothetical protein
MDALLTLSSALQLDDILPYLIVISITPVQLVTQRGIKPDKKHRLESSKAVF